MSVDKKVEIWEYILIMFALIVGSCCSFGLMIFVEFNYSLINLFELFLLLLITISTITFVGDYTIKLILKNEDEDNLLYILYFFLSVLFSIAFSIMMGLIINIIFLLSGIIVFLFFISCMVLISVYLEKNKNIQLNSLEKQ